MRVYALRLHIWLFLLLFCAAFRVDEVMAAAETPHASQGLLDISEWSLERDGTIPLVGEWAFYWNRLLEPSDFTRPSSTMAPAYVQVPKEWNHYTINAKPLSNQGYATYRLLIKLAPGEVSQHQALYISGIATAYRLWIDGKPAAANGKVGTSRSLMIPAHYAQMATFIPDKPQVELVIQVSNFVQRKGGMWSSIRLGREEGIGYEREKNIAMNAALTASLAIMGIYHLVLFTLRHKDKSPLYFGVLCMAIAVRSLFVGESLGARLLTGFSWEWGVKFEYLGFILGIALIMALVYTQYPDEMSKTFRNISSMISILAALAVFATSASVFTYMMQYFQVWILLCFGYMTFVYALALSRRRESAGINCVSLLFFIVTAVNDVLYYNQIISTGDWFPIGLIGALLAQSFIISRTFSRSFKQTEKLSGELAAINESLEQRIKDRTLQLRRTVADLQQANSDLSQMEASRRQLMSGISHELGTPLTSIQGYVNAMMDGTVDPGNPKYLNRIHEKTKYLDRLIGDMLDLSRLEARQVAFHFEPLPADDFFRHLFEKYELEVRANGKRFEWSGTGAAEPGENNDGRTAYFSGDPLRVEQVVANLLSNARKYTPEGGTIRMQLRIEPEPGAVILRVSDTGTGIAEEDLPYIFDRFYRGRSSKERQSAGTGLGLAIAKEIVEAHNGTIGAEGQPGQGSTFYFKLPAWGEPAGGNDKKGA